MKSWRLCKIHATYNVIWLPKTIEEIRALQPSELQNWVFEQLHGKINPKKTSGFGIDGWVWLDVLAQAKQSE